jgi:hypothetical protein
VITILFFNKGLKIQKLIDYFTLSGKKIIPSALGKIINEDNKYLKLEKEAMSKGLHK